MILTVVNIFIMYAEECYLHADIIVIFNCSVNHKQTTVRFRFKNIVFCLALVSFPRNLGLEGITLYKLG